MKQALVSIIRGDAKKLIARVIEAGGKLERNSKNHLVVTLGSSRAEFSTSKRDLHPSVRAALEKMLKSV